MHDKKLDFSRKASEELAVFSEAVREIMELALSVFRQEDVELARKIEPLEEAIDSLNAEIKRRHVKRLRSGDCTIELGFILADVTTSYERVADHCSNVAVSLLEISEDGFGAHEYLERLKKAGNEEFLQTVEQFREKYRLS